MKWDRLLSYLLAVFTTVTNYFLGGFDTALQTLCMFMVLDYITGITAAHRNEEVSSSKCRKGINRKIMILVVVGVAVAIDRVTNAQGMIRNMVIFFYTSMEGISILENAARMGVPIPEFLTKALIQLKEGNKKSKKEND